MTKKDRKLEWKVGSAIIIIFFALLTWLIAGYFYVGSSKEIVSTADQFKPGADWMLKKEHIEPPRNSCIDTVCPQVYRAWSLPQKLDKQQFEQLAKVGVNKLAIAKSCLEKNESGQVIELCDAAGTIDGYKFALSYSGNGYDDSPKVTLIVEKRR